MCTLMDQKIVRFGEVAATKTTDKLFPGTAKTKREIENFRYMYKKQRYFQLGLHGGVLVPRVKKKRKKFYVYELLSPTYMT